MDLYAGQTVLDVASGNGNVSLAAARRFSRSYRPTMRPPCWINRDGAPLPMASPSITGINSPSTWGTQSFLDTHFGSCVSDIHARPRQFMFRYNSPEHWLDLFSKFYGPMLKAFGALDDQTGASLREDIMQLIAKHNRAARGPMVVASDYLEVVIIR